MKSPHLHSPEQYMRMALRLAARARGRTSPNPMVGAVVVKDGRILGRGFHHRAGAAHAEINALADAGREAAGADLYLNLEPCSHYGRTPPCTDAVIAHKIRRVFVGMSDPNPLVRGRGIQKLRRAGIEVRVGILEEKCQKLNEVFVKYITTGLPFVVLKAAASLDGRTAAETGDSKWISNDMSRRFVHRLRDQVDAILVGVGTVIQDNPQLTTRLGRRGQRDPIRVVVDSRLRIPLSARVLDLQSEARTIVAASQDAPNERIRALEEKGAQVIVIASRPQVDLGLLMTALARQEISSVLIEGGSRINTAALESGIVDKVMLFYAPLLMGGTLAPLIMGGKGVAAVKEAIELRDLHTRRFGEDVLIEGYVKQSEK